MKRLVLEAEHEEFRKTARDVIERELEPNAEEWCVQLHGGHGDMTAYRVARDVGL